MMALSFNRDGSVTMISDYDGSTSVVAPGWTPSSLSAAYLAFQTTWPLAFLQQYQQAGFDAYFDYHFDLKAFIRAGTVATVTAANIGAFLAQITNNYRSIRAQIFATTSQSQLLAIDWTQGWPSNP